MKTIFLITGPVCSGKETLVRYAETNGLKRIRPYTTDKRKAERNKGYDYMPMTEALNKMISADAVGKCGVGNHYCFTTVERLEDGDIYIADVWGAEALKKYGQTSDKFDFVSIYLDASYDVRLQRSYMRGEYYPDFCREDTMERFLMKDYKLSVSYDFLINTEEDPERTYKKLDKIITVYKLLDQKEEMIEKLELGRIVQKIGDGYLQASLTTDPEYPGIDIEYVPYHQPKGIITNPRVLVEKPKDGSLRALAWSNPAQEDYTEEITFE